MKFRPVILQFLGVFFALLGCSVEKLAVRSVAPRFQRSAIVLEREANWDVLEKSVPTFILINESLLNLDPSNSTLKAILIESHMALGFGVYETLWLQASLAEDESLASELKWKALYHYSKAMSYGLDRFQDWKLKEVMPLEQFAVHIKKQISDLSLEEHRAGVFFILSWMAMMNLDRTQMKLLSELSKAKLVLDALCEQNPKVIYGLCPLFLAAYEAGRPKALGGNPSLAKSLIAKGIQDHPDNLMLLAGKIQYYAKPLGLEQEIKNDLKTLEDLGREWHKEKLYQGLDLGGNFSSNLNMFNAVALKRAGIIKKYQKQFLD